MVDVCVGQITKLVCGKGRHHSIELYVGGCEHVYEGIECLCVCVMEHTLDLGGGGGGGGGVDSDGAHDRPLCVCVCVCVRERMLVLASYLP